MSYVLCVLGGVVLGYVIKWRQEKIRRQVSTLDFTPRFWK